jgi:hypothetical protein
MRLGTALRASQERWKEREVREPRISRFRAFGVERPCGELANARNQPARLRSQFVRELTFRPRETVQRDSEVSSSANSLSRARETVQRDSEVSSSANSLPDRGKAAVDRFARAAAVLEADSSSWLALHGAARRALCRDAVRGAPAAAQRAGAPAARSPRALLPRRSARALLPRAARGRSCRGAARGRSCRGAARGRSHAVRLSATRLASLVFGKAFARSGAERTPVREHRTAAKTQPKPKIARRARPST